MVRIKSQNELVLNLLDFYRIAQPNLDLKPGSVSRDLLVDGPSAQLSKLYSELQRISNLQSLRLSVGTDLDNLGSNYGTSRRKGSKASGPALLTFKEINRDIPIKKGDIIYAKNGSTFSVSNNLVISQVYANNYRAVATQYRSDLELANITDEYAVEILVEATSPGIQGNISKYNLSSTNISGITNVTNAFPFGGGRPSEDDATFRSRILAVFSGANTGTSVGYRNAALQDPSVLDALVIEPGDPLMIRDGTQVYTDPETGEKNIISEGTGGKVDIYVLGVRLLEIVESYIYRDKSNTGNPIDTKNDYVLGQIAGDENKTVTRKRLENLQEGIIPNQPVNNIVQVSGSVTGGNYLPKNVDELGRVTGNYELIPDTGVYGGSPWGFDRLRWISDHISDLLEDKNKLLFNGQDSLTYPNVLGISTCSQRVSVVNENSKVNSTDRSIIQLSHSPTSSVTRVFNVTTGERYIVVSQNLDGSGTINKTGRIRISGSSLPAVSDTLEVDYTWIFNYDSEIDFDGKLSNLNPNIREVQDSIDWGYSNAVRREQCVLTTSGSVLVGSVIHPISSIINVNIINQHTTNVTIINGRLAVVLPQQVNNIVIITRTYDGSDLWNTSKSNGSFSNFVVFLPTDGVAAFGDEVNITYNTVDIYNTDTPGSFDNNIITIVPSVIAVPGLVEVNYISNVSNLLPNTQLNQLPAIRNLNKFNTTTQTNIGNQPISNTYDISGNLIQNLRQAPSNISLTVSGSISPGVFTLTGNTLYKSSEAVFTIGTGGLVIELSGVLRKALGLNSTASIPSNVSICRVTKVEKVETTSNLDVLSVLHTYDLKSYILKDNSYFKSESIVDSNTLAVNQGRNLLTSTQFKLPETSDNLNNAPQIGNRVRVTFYYVINNDTENVLFSKSGTLVSNKRFLTLNSVVISSGFTSNSSQNATLSINNFNQPITGSRYSSNYDYTAPVPNERISIRYNLNKLIGDTTINVESVRLIGSDVLVKQAEPILIDVTINIVLFKEFITNSNTVKQNVQDAVTAALNSNSLGTTIDSSDLVVVSQGVQGVDRARVLYFNKSNEPGSVLSIEASKSQYLQANNVTINIETR